MKSEKLSFEETIEMIMADSEMDQETIQKVEKLLARVKELDKLRKNIKKLKKQAFSQEDLDKELQAIIDQLDSIMEEDLRAEHPNYERLIEEVSEGK
ncbi:hypothetical protein JZU61_04225 [bacterium]|jgi:uncharacterized membrane-anchored protein YjiN (DUF445 family)|nr:hypothetical protein [bacterium]MBV5348847.1 hypothetical protein [bacterium]